MVHRFGWAAAVVAAVALVWSSGCTTVLRGVYESVETVPLGQPEVRVDYAVSDGRLEAGHLVVPVYRSCTQIEHINEIVTETRITDPEVTMMGWSAISSVAVMALVPGMIALFDADVTTSEWDVDSACDSTFGDAESCARAEENLEDARDERSSAYGVLGAGALVGTGLVTGALIYDANDERTTESILRSDNLTIETPMSSCPAIGDDTALVRVGPDGPVIEGTLFSDNFVAGISGREDIDWSQAPGFWVRLPESDDWTSVPNGSALAAEIRDWGAIDPTADPRRVLVYTEVDDDDLGSVLVQRVRAALTVTGRYTVMADDSTRSQVGELIESSTGSPSERMRFALAQANLDLVDNVVWITSTPLDARTHLIDIALYDALSGDITFSTNTTAESGDAVGVLAAVDRMMERLAEE